MDTITTGDACLGCGELLDVEKRVYPVKGGHVCAACQIAIEGEAALQMALRFIAAGNAAGRPGGRR